jgi:prevent-host-death family protein
MARIYPVHEAKAKLSEILRRVKRGRSITISEHGRPIARVVPITTASDLASRIAWLEREGVVLRRRGHAREVRTIARKPGALRRFLADRE